MSRILILDDDTNLARLFARVLDKQGYHVDCVTNTNNARALLNA